MYMKAPLVRDVSDALDSWPDSYDIKGIQYGPGWRNSRWDRTVEVRGEERKNDKMTGIPRIGS